MIEINNLTSNVIDEELLEAVARKILKEERAGSGIGLSIAFVGPGEIRRINKKYRNKDCQTDVLAFSTGEAVMKEQKSKIAQFQKIHGLGEIVISPEIVRKNAKRFGSNFETELVRVSIHGILHLLGYDHEKSGGEAIRMREKEIHYLSGI